MVSDIRDYVIDEADGILTGDSKIDNSEEKKLLTLLFFLV